MSILEAVMDENMEALRDALSVGNIDEQDPESGFSALHYCAQYGNVEMAKLLIDNGASVNLKDNYGNTALFKAVFFSDGKTDIIKLLIGAGADPDEENNSGMTPKKLAENIATFDITEAFK